MTLTKSKYIKTKDGLIGIEVTYFGNCRYQVLGECRLHHTGSIHRSISGVTADSHEDVLEIVVSKIRALRPYAGRKL